MESRHHDTDLQIIVFKLSIYKVDTLQKSIIEAFPYMVCPQKFIYYTTKQLGMYNGALGPLICFLFRNFSVDFSQQNRRIF